MAIALTGSSINLLLLLIILLLPSITMSISVDGCDIQSDSSGAVGVPTFKGRSISGSRIYSCSNNHNCSYSVHVLGVYEANNRHSFNYHPIEDSNVYIRTSGSGDTRPLVLVLSSYEPVNWILHIPSSVVIKKVIVSSFLTSTVSYSSGQVLEVENDLSFYAYGSDSGGGHTDRLLQIISQRISPVNSFTGTYQANKWILNINRSPSAASQDCPVAGSSIPGGRTCSTPSSPRNGKVSVTGSIATYSCNPGYTLRGTSIIFCSNGRWSRSFTPTCEALLNVDGCSIEVDSPEAVGSPYYRGSVPSTYKIYSCLNHNNCSYSVHVLGVYEASSLHGFNYHPTRTSNVYLSTSGSGDKRPLVLVLSSYEPINWNLNIPSNLVIDKVIVSSYYDSDVTYSRGRVLEVQKDLSFSGYGSDSGGGQTQRLLQTISQRFSPVTSFTGTYQADRWNVIINRNVPTSNQCPMVGATFTTEQENEFYPTNNYPNSGGSASCARLLHPLNGRVTIVDVTAVYSCNAGYILNGSGTRNCVNGFWNGRAPSCEPQVGAPRHATGLNMTGVIIIVVGIVVIFLQVAIVVIYIVAKKNRKKKNVLPPEDTSSPPTYNEVCSPPTYSEVCRNLNRHDQV